MSEEIKQDIAAQIAQYKSLEYMIRLGVYYNLAFPTKYGYSAYYYASPDASELFLTVIENPSHTAYITDEVLEGCVKLIFSLILCY